MGAHRRHFGAPPGGRDAPGLPPRHGATPGVASGVAPGVALKEVPRGTRPELEMLRRLVRTMHRDIFEAAGIPLGIAGRELAEQLLQEAQRLRSENGEVLLSGVGTLRYALILGENSACQVPICCAVAA